MLPPLHAHRDVDVAKALGISLRRLRKVIDENGLCLKASNRRVLTRRHIALLEHVLQVSPCRLTSTGESPASSTYAERITASPLTEALALASELKQKRSAKSSTGRSSMSKSSASRRNDHLRKQPSDT